MEKKQQWGSRLGFILAAVGSAIGLGNIWRFPYMVYENGGGAFLIPYFVALLTAGIPIMIMEFSLGHKSRAGAPRTFSLLNKKWEWLGWWQTGISAVIAVYYVAIIGWSFSYMFFSLNGAWGDEPASFFLNDFLRLTSGPFEMGTVQFGILFTIVIAWTLNFLASYGGVQKGLERANKLLMPVLIVVLLIVVVRALSLPGAVHGLEILFKPDFSQIMNPSVWVAAYGQIFFSLSIAFAIMITYSSYLPKKSDIVNNAFMTAFLNCGFSILAGIAIFSIIGYLQHQAGGSLPDNMAGVFLAFVTLPSAVTQLPALNGLIGVLLFMTLSFAGLSSFISINEVVVRSIVDKFGANRRKVSVWYNLIAGTISIVFATGAGLHILDIVDHYINSYGIVFSGLIQVVLVGWFYDLKSVRDHANLTSDFKVGAWWDLMIRFVTPAVLGVNSILNLITDLRVNYGGYSTLVQIVLGWGLIAVLIIAAVAAARFKWQGGDTASLTQSNEA
ncbi:MAG: sodium-dependent transporter [Spirochaetales bacterium]|nr:sodium-dependent transporter [Spirochaetales bacterium]